MGLDCHLYYIINVYPILENRSSKLRRMGRSQSAYPLARIITDGRRTLVNSDHITLIGISTSTYIPH
jgi:hypothetical protein